MRRTGRVVAGYLPLFVAIQVTAYFGKLAIHPDMANHFYESTERAKIGPIPGWIVLCCGLVYNLCWIVLAIGSWWADRRAHKHHPSAAAMG